MDEPWGEEAFIMKSMLRDVEPASSREDTSTIA